MKVSAALIALFVALLGTGAPAHAQTPADPLGTVQSSSIACQGKNNGGKCYQLEISCPLLPDYTGYVKVLEPTVPVTGTTMFVTGGGTTDLLELRPFGPIVVTKLKAAGYRIAELTFGAPFNVNELGWETNAGGAGVRAAACRYATVLQWVHDTFQEAGTPLCAAGNSAGAEEIGQALAHYGMGNLLAFAELSSGPPYGRLDYACENTQAVTTSPCSGDKSSLALQPGTAAKFVDPAYPGAWCSSAFATHSKEHDAQFINDSVISPDATLSYPNTFVNFLFGSLDNTSAIRQGLLYQSAIKSKKGMACLAGVPHEMEDSMAGAQRVAADFLLRCKLSSKQ